MLVLNRKLGEAILIDGPARIEILEFRWNAVRVGIEAPLTTKVVREEIATEPPDDEAA